MASSLHDPRYKKLVALLINARRSAGLTQRDLAARLKQPPSYVGKLESRQRRLDVIELIDVLNAIGIRPPKFLTDLMSSIKDDA